MTMTCDEIKELTVPYLELDLEPSRVREVTAHLDGCAGCRAEMEAVRQVLVRVKGMTVPDPGDQFWEEFPERVRRELAQVQGRRRGVGPARWRPRTAAWPLAVAAALVLLVAAWSVRGLFEWGSAPTPTGPSVAQSSPAPGNPVVVELYQEMSVDFSNLSPTEWEEAWEDDPDTDLVEMARHLDRQTLDRLFTDI